MLGALARALRLRPRSSPAVMRAITVSALVVRTVLLVATAASLHAVLKAGPGALSGAAGRLSRLQFLDVLLSVTAPVHPLLELAFNAASLAVVVLLTAWSGQESSEVSSTVRLHVWQRLAVVAGAHHLRNYLRGLYTSTPTRPKPIPTVNAFRSSAARPQQAASGHAEPTPHQPSASSPDSASARLPPADHSSAPHSDGPPSAAFELCGSGASWSAEAGAADASAASAKAFSASHAGPPLEVSCDAASGVQSSVAAIAAIRADASAVIGNSPATAACAAADGAAVSAVAAAAPRGCPLASYKSPIRRRTTRIKIPFAEPEQLGPGFVERLRALAADRGTYLAAVYVRAGCIELQLDDEVYWGSGCLAKADMQGGSPSHARGLEGSVSGSRARLAAEDGPDALEVLLRELAAGVGEDADDANPYVKISLPDVWDASSVIRALELEQPQFSESDACETDEQDADEDAPRAAAASSGPAAAAAAGVTVQSVRLGGGGGGNGGGGCGGSSGGFEAAAQELVLHSASPSCVASVAAAAAFGAPQPRIVALNPRVLLLPPPPPQRPAAADQPEAVPAAAAPAPAPARPVANLSVYVAGPAPAGGGAAAAEEPEVLVRSAGVYLPARAVRVDGGAAGGGGGLAGPGGGGVYDSGADAAARPDHAQGCDVDGKSLYRIDLYGLPCQPGVLLVELRWGGELGRSLPLLAVRDAAMAAELKAAAATWPGPRGELDDLILDLGTWAHHAAAATAATTPAAPAAAGAGAAGVAAAAAAVAATGKGGGGGTAAAGAAGARRALPPRLTALGGHLLRYAEACGWAATAARIQTELAALCYGSGNGGDGGHGGAGEVAAAVAAPSPPVGRGAAESAAAADACCSKPQAPVAAAAYVHLVTAGAAGAAAAAGGAGGVAAAAAAAPDGGTYRAVAWRVLPSSLLRGMGLQRGSPEEEEAYTAFAAPFIFAQGHIIQAVECLSLLALLFRARHDIFSRGNLTTVAGCAVGTLTALAWPLLSRARWVAVVNAAKLPRYFAYMLAKLMIAALRFPAPPGIVSYQLGPGMLVMEGVLLPGSCLLPPGTALAITLAKLPLGVGMLIKSGATDNHVFAVALCLRVVALAMVTTVLCHTYLRVCFALRSDAQSKKTAAKGHHAH